MIRYLLTTFIAFLFSLFSTAVISYVAMATPIGPWMEMTLVLLGTIIFRSFMHRASTKIQMRSLAFTTAAGGIGGAVAMACAFSFPTLYFLDPQLFSSMMNNPFYFCSMMAALVIAAGSFGFLIASQFEKRLLNDPAMLFPIGQMVYNMIAIQNQFHKAIQLACGALSALSYSFLQTFTQFIPARITLLPHLNFSIFNIPLVTTRTDMIPMFWAIGFTTGHVIALPLLVAVIARIFLVDPMHTLFFHHLSHIDFILAFGAGMAIQGALLGMIDVPKSLSKTIKKLGSFVPLYSLRSGFDAAQGLTHHRPSTRPPTALSECNESKGTNGQKFFKYIYKKFTALILLLIPIVFLTYFAFSLPAQIYLLSFTVICTYQLLIIAGKLGIAPLGRFATFVMIPGLLLFGFNALQITFLATFVEIAGVVAVDMMFGQKVAQLGSIEHPKMLLYQWLGLLISAISIGAIFWLLISHFGLGSPELIASRAQSRAVLVHAFNFDYVVMLLGFVFSYCLKFIGVNPTLVFGGLLMGLDTSLMLIAGGLSTYLVKEKEEHYPFWSGVYATNSIWIFIKMLF